MLGFTFQEESMLKARLRLTSEMFEYLRSHRYRHEGSGRGRFQTHQLGSCGMGLAPVFRVAAFFQQVGVYKDLSRPDRRLSEAEETVTLRV